jgi:Fe-S cluster assembly iron-binding protein IscA
LLAVTENATSAIEGMLASPQLPDDAGLRITTETAPTEDGTPRTEFRIGVAEAPEPGDQVVDDAPVFIEPEAATLLDDKVLDAQVAGEQVSFSLAEQA